MCLPLQLCLLLAYFLTSIDLHVGMKTLNNTTALLITGIQLIPEILPRLHFGLFHCEAVDFRPFAYRKCTEELALFCNNAL